MHATLKPKKGRGFLAYNFMDKDPIIDRMRRMIEKEGLTLQEVSIASGVTIQTLYNWFRGETRKPQFATAMAVIRGLGYNIRFMKGSNVA